MSATSNAGRPDTVKAIVLPSMVASLGARREERRRGEAAAKTEEDSRDDGFETATEAKMADSQREIAAGRLQHPLMGALTPSCGR